MLKINKWLYPGIRIKRWIFLLLLSLFVFMAGFSGMMGSAVKNIKIKTPINVDSYFYKLQRMKFLDFFMIALGTGGVILAVRRAYFSVITMVMPNREKEYLNLAYKKAKLKRGPKIATIGGGTGLPNVLRGLKEYTSNLSAIVTVADDGGSSGRLRKDYQILPPGDIRNCLVALADEETLLGKLFKYRFETGEDLAGHNFGNIFITALTHVVGGDFSRAIEESSKVLAIQGRVLPVSLDNVTISAVLSDGRVIKGESNIPKAKGKIEKLEIYPKNCKPNIDAIKAISEADAVVMGPGSLYTSVIPNLLVSGIKEALEGTKVLKIYVCNIMTQPGETDGYTVSDHIKAIFRHAGEKSVDIVIANNHMPARDVLERYAAEGAYPVKIDKEEISRLGVRLVEAKLFNDGEYIRHSDQRLGRIIMKTMII